MRVFLYDQLRDVFAPGQPATHFAFGEMWGTKSGHMVLYRIDKDEHKVHGCVVKVDKDEVLNTGNNFYNNDVELIPIEVFDLTTQHLEMVMVLRYWPHYTSRLAISDYFEIRNDETL